MTDAFDAAGRPLPPVLARREMLRTRFFTAVEEDLPDRHGQPYTYHQIEAHHEAVVVIPELDDGRFVVERIYRHPYRAHVLEFPAGGLDIGEDPCAAAARELAEETGYLASACERLATLAPMPGLLRMQMHLVLARGLRPGGTIAHEALEHITVAPMTASEIDTAIRSEFCSGFLAQAWWAYLWASARGGAHRAPIEPST